MIEAILKRRSIRKFTNQKVEDEKIEEMLKAGMLAPSAHNLNPVRFVIIKSKEAFQHIMSIHPYTSMLKTADVAILVVGNRNITTNDGFLYADCSSAITNILLQGCELGLGTCWCGVAPSVERCQAFSEYFELEENYLPFGLIAVGYPDEVKGMKETIDLSKIIKVVE